MMNCFVLRSRHDLSQNVTIWPERIVVLSAFSLVFFLLFILYLSFQQQAQNVLILTRNTLAFNRKQRTASRRRWCWWALHAMYNRPQQRPSPRRFICKIWKTVNRKKMVFGSPQYTRSTIYVERLNVISWFCDPALSSNGILYISFLKQTRGWYV